MFAVIPNYFCNVPACYAMIPALFQQSTGSQVHSLFLLLEIPGILASTEFVDRIHTTFCFYFNLCLI